MVFRSMLAVIQERDLSRKPKAVFMFHVLTDILCTPMKAAMHPAILGS